MGLILNIETATAICSVSLAKDGVVFSQRETNEPNSHSLLLGSFIEEVLLEVNIQPSDLDAIAVSGGPGSYTGLRIGVSLAKGLSYSLNIPLISIPTLMAMANGILNKYKTEYLIPMIDARRMEVYGAIYDSKIKLIKDVEPIIIDEHSFSDLLSENRVVFFGDGASKCKTLINSPNALFVEDGLPSAKSMVTISEAKYMAKEFENTAYYEPFYLKEFQAKVSKVKGLK